MRYSISPDFAAAQRRHVESYDKHDAFAAAGDDHSPEAVAASEEEYRYLDALMQTPAQAPGDVLAKLRLFLDREMYGWNGPRSPDAGATYRAIIEADLLNLNRPCVSSQMDEAFSRWAAAAMAMHTADYGSDDQLPQAVRDEYIAAAEAVHELPCVAPGDIVVKVYLTGMDGDGGYPQNPSPFLIKDWSERNEPQSTYLRDLSESDLGRCMLALGRTDFDAKDWINGMEQCAAGQSVSIVYQTEGGMLFGISEPNTDPEPYPGAHARYRLLQYLINGGVANERREQVIDHILAERPDLVFGKRP